ncbi:unnamed protein product [Sphacelaria rigidula]
MIFWENLLRYPRFFISSIIGLILILFNPLIIYLKNVNSRKFVILIIGGFFLFLFWIVKTMITGE